jgi:hypothetical protein
MLDDKLNRGYGIVVKDDKLNRGYGECKLFGVLVFVWVAVMCLVLWISWSIFAWAVNHVVDQRDVERVSYVVDDRRVCS